MKSNLRITKKTPVKAKLYGNGKILSHINDSGFRGREAVIDELIRRVPFYSGRTVEYMIEDAGTGDYVTGERKVNK